MSEKIINKASLTNNMSNLLAYRLGLIVKEVFNRDESDEIDRGLILLRLLNENQFSLSYYGDTP